MSNAIPGITRQPVDQLQPRFVWCNRLLDSRNRVNDGLCNWRRREVRELLLQVELENPSRLPERRQDQSCGVPGDVAKAAREQCACRVFALRNIFMAVLVSRLKRALSSAIASATEFQSALAKVGDELIADVPNYTNIDPVIQISEYEHF